MENKDIKVGQIYQQGNNEVCVVTQVSDNIFGRKWFSIVYRDGYALTYDESEENKDFIFYKKIAEYPTWQEAVNSKEFRKEG